MKWRWFLHLHGGGDEDAERVYLWMIDRRSGVRMKAGRPTDQWKLSLQDYLVSGQALYEEISKNGFSPRYPIPVDPDGELLNGSHRVALGLALGLKTIPVRREDRYVWAPPWGTRWFIDHGIHAEDLVRAIRDSRAMIE